MAKSPMLVLALALPSAAQAQVTIFAINNIRGPGETSDRLVSFQSNNPAGWTSIGLTGATNVQFVGLDFAGIGGGLYAWGSNPQSGPVGLFSINPATGAATLLQQGPPTPAIRDLSWNPVTNQMVGLQTNPCRLYNIDLTNGATTLIGEVTGIPSPGGSAVEGLAHDSSGNIYIYDQFTDDIYFGAGLAVTTLHQNLPNTDFSQGMVVDWSRDNQGYHAAFGLLPQFFSDLYTFTSAPNSYELVGNFGTPSGTFPTFEGGDLAIRPIPTPGTAAILGLATLAARRRRR
jgi:hypothetical protein